MSDEQQLAAIGRTVEDYAACKKKLAALEGEAIKEGNMLFEIGNALRTADRGGASGLVALVNSRIGQFPTADSIRILAQDIKTEFDRKNQLYAALKNMGIEPKD